MVEPEHGTSAQHRREMEVYQAYKLGLKIFDILVDISPICRISVMFDTISTIDNRLRGKSRKKSVISTIYHRYISFGLIYRGTCMLV